MSNREVVTGALVLFKKKVGIINGVEDKITIQLEGGVVKRVRAKDIEVLHPGPVKSLDNLKLSVGNITEAWEMIEDETVSLCDLAELIYDEYTPASAWSTWLILEESLYFSGTIDSITANSKEYIESIQQARSEKEEAALLWQESIARIKNGEPTEADVSNLKEVEKLANGQSEASKVMRELKIEQTPEKAHKLLLKLGRWDEFVNPYPARFGVKTENASGFVPEIEDEHREDLTHLQAFAIDDEGNKDPDDAISIDGNKLWIHIADVSSLVRPGSELDKEAQTRGSNVYLPEGCVHMLPRGITEKLGLGLNEVSPAFSFGVTFNDDMSIADVELKPSFVKVTRMTYLDVNSKLDKEPFSSILSITRAYEKRRNENGALSVYMPEVKIYVDDRVVSIRSLPSYESRELVTNAMLIAGEAVALFCQENGIPVPYVTQTPPDEFEDGEELSTQFANVRKFNRSEIKVTPDYHAGLGLDAYVRATSPLRRYSDLLVHQQLRAFIGMGEVLSEDVILEKISESQAAADASRLAERESNKHWTAVYLMQNPDWTGKAVLVEKREHRGTWIIPELNLQTKLSLKSDLPLDSEVELKLNKVELPELITRFRIIK